MNPCPHCAESMQDAAVVCPHCGRSIYRTQRIRIAVAVAVTATTLAGGMCAYVVDTADRAAREAEAKIEQDRLRQLMGPPPPPAEEAALIIRQAIFRAAMRAIIEEGKRAGWPPEL